MEEPPKTTLEPPPKIPLGPRLQQLIHLFEVGLGTQLLKWGVLALATITLFVGYNWRAYKNLAAPEAMDAAQLARNLAEGKGYTTLFVRPLSIYLLTNHDAAGFALNVSQADPGRLKRLHPDLANPPLYPLLLAGLMKVLPFQYDIPGSGVVSNAKAGKYFWNKGGRFWWYPPDFLIALFNQLLFLAMVVLTYFLAQRLFDVWVAWVSAILLLGTELLWRFSVSGLSTMLLLLLFVGVAWCLSLAEQSVRESKWGASAPAFLAAGAGLLTGLGGLTRYAFAWIILPVLLFLMLFTGRRRAVNALAALAVFATVMTPWAVRNYHLCGLPFGTATFAVLENTPPYPEYQLERTLQPNYHKYSPAMLWYKVVENTRAIVSDELPKLAGTWVSAFFLVGLMLAFIHPGVSRLRYFVLFCLPVLVIVQAASRTALSDESPVVNSENLLVLLTPLVVVFGVSLFFVLLDRMELAVIQLRFAIIGLFSATACLPMILLFLPPRPYTGTYPPYYPPGIQIVCNWMKPTELMMSDVPWAVAWYGRRQCVWLTLNAQDDFFAINDYLKPVNALYLTPETMDGKFISHFYRPGEHSWGSFVLDVQLRKELPPDFPLRKSLPGFLPEQFFISDWARWDVKQAGHEP